MSTRTTNLAKNKIKIGTMLVELDRVIHEIVVNGTASATLSAGGGSKSYSRIDLDKLRAMRAEYADRFTQINRALTVGSSPAGIRHVMTTRCWGW